jgi:mannitol-specific phosphotransferase system IIBC component
VLAWIKNNVVSVVLFGVAAVMLILIIVLLLVKPSDETLEDIDKEVEKKKDKKKEDKEAFTYSRPPNKPTLSF